MLKCGPAGTAALLATVAIIGAGCGGEDDFANEPRPPAPVQLTGVITEKGVTVSPDRVGAGPVVILISNQTQRSHTITLEGDSTTDTVGPINPLDTAKLQQTLEQGRYTVEAGSSEAVADELKPATLKVGKPRPPSSDEVLLP
jgi:hypothetical protein